MGGVHTLVCHLLHQKFDIRITQVPIYSVTAVSTLDQKCGGNRELHTINRPREGSLGPGSDNTTEA